MPRTTPTTMTVGLSGPLSDFVSANVGEHGDCENVGDLIHRDKEQEAKVFERLKAELIHGCAAPESSYKPLTAADVIARNRACQQCQRYKPTFRKRRLSQSTKSTAMRSMGYSADRTILLCVRWL